MPRMTAYRCWIEFPNDKSLQLRVQRGELENPAAVHFSRFQRRRITLAGRAVLVAWCRERKLNPIVKA